MKLKIIITILFSIILNFSFAQCKEQFFYDCAVSYFDGIYLQNFNTNLVNNDSCENNTKKFSFQLKKGIRYGLNFCSPDVESEIIVNLYNKNDSLLATTDNIYKENAFSYICKNTDIYYITICISNNSKIMKTSVVVVLSFLGKNK